MKILIVDDDQTIRLILQTMLKEYETILTDSGELGLEMAEKDVPDLVILDINLPGIDGYETCRQLRARPEAESIPIIFLSEYVDLEDRLRAYGAGGTDYVSKPFDMRELLNKIARYTSNAYRQHREMQSTQQLLFGVQKNAANLQSIGRFIQVTPYCLSLDAIADFFFRTAGEIGLDCVLQIQANDQTLLRSSDSLGVISAFEREILKLAGAVDRIHDFGNNRAIFRWTSAALLVRRVDQMHDIIAMLMNALEAAIKNCVSQTRLLQQMDKLKVGNEMVRDNVEDAFNEMRAHIKAAIISMGLISGLDASDEDVLSDLIETFSQRVDQELKVLGENNQILHGLVEDLRSPPEELSDLLHTTEEDGTTLF
jgi:DNA-binding response OmpR family regulator